MEEAPNLNPEDMPDEVKELLNVLEKKFKHSEVVFNIHVPEHLRPVFEGVFGKKFLNRTEWEKFINHTVVTVPQVGGRPSEKSEVMRTPSISVHLGNKDSESVHIKSARKCAQCMWSAQECTLFGLRCKDINLLQLMDAIGNVLKRRLEEEGKFSRDATRTVVKLAVMHLLLVKECTHEELVRAIFDLAKEIEHRHNVKKRVAGLDRKTKSVLANIDGIVSTEERSIPVYLIRDSLIEEIEEEYYRLMGIQKQYEMVEKEIEKKSTLEDLDDAVERFADFIENYVDADGKHTYIDQLVENISVKNMRAIVIDWMHLNSYDTGLAHKLLESMECDALIRKLEDGIRLFLQKNPLFGSTIPRISVRIFNLPRTLAPRDIRKEHLLHFVQVEGIISRVSDIKPTPVRAVYICNDCGNEMVRYQEPYLPMARPLKCDACGSRNIELNIARSIFENVQSLRIQDDPSVLSGRTLPRHLDVIVLGDLVDYVAPGDRVRITGVYLAVQKDPKNPMSFKKILVVNNIEKLSKTMDEVEYSEADIPVFREEVSKKDFEEKFIRSIAPGVHGMEKVKLGIALSLLGGEEQKLADGTTVRGRIHILELGDPGVAKSTLLDFVKHLSPRAVRSTGRGTTAAGITAAAVKDEITGEWVLEAGTLVLADQGVALIDELDKMRDHDRSNIHQAMEQGIVSINKAGIVADLNARTTVIAAANPRYGRWNRRKSVAEQIGFNPTLLSRFDLIYLILDEPDEDFDRQLIEHLKRRQDKNELMKDVYDVEFLRKFIAYARKEIHPVLSEGAWEYLKDYYVSLRRRASKNEEDGITRVPITARQAEALIRLATAHAKLHLRKVVTIEDMEVAVGLMEYTMRHLNPDNQLDTSVIYVGRPTEEVQILEKLEEIIRLLDDGEGAPYSAIESEARIQLRLTTNEIREYLSQLLRGRKVLYMGRIGDTEYYKAVMES